MDAETASNGRLLNFIRAGILIWGVVLAGGVMWYDYYQGAVNLWKPTIIVIGVVLFVAGWSLALASRPAPPQQP